jgi:glycosyltransferase involved in cell wall biosynthesis
VYVQLVDPAADSPAYDHQLAAALARRGADVELVTSRFLYASLAAAREYRVTESFYRYSTRLGLKHRRRRRAIKALEHVPDMLRHRRLARPADVRHYQWLSLEALDLALLCPTRPRVMTMHNVLRRGDARRTMAVTRQLADRMDAVVVHTKGGARRLEELGVDPARVHVIAHGAFDYLARLEPALPLPPELAAVEGPVVLVFGLVRPYKGVDVLLRAFKEVHGAELWVVGRQLSGTMAEYHDLARQVSCTVRFVTDYVPEAQVQAYFRRADIVVLPHRRIDQSGVLHIGLAFGKPMVVSALGGFIEVAEEHGAVRLVPPEHPAALADAIQGLLDAPDERMRLARQAERAAANHYSWDRIAAGTLDLYDELLLQRK